MAPRFTCNPTSHPAAASGWTNILPVSRCLPELFFPFSVFVPSNRAFYRSARLCQSADARRRSDWLHERVPRVSALHRIWPGLHLQSSSGGRGAANVWRNNIVCTVQPCLAKQIGTPRLFVFLPQHSVSAYSVAARICFQLARLFSLSRVASYMTCCSRTRVPCVSRESNNIKGRFLLSVCWV